MRLLTLVIMTVAEVLGLAFWLHDAHQGHSYRGLIWLSTGLAIEVGMLIAFLYRGSVAETNRSALQVNVRLIGIALFEFIIWLIWLYLMQAVGYFGGIIALAVLMHIKHDADLATISDTNLFLKVFTPKGLTATGLEVLGAVVCYMLVLSEQFWLGTVILLACITVEHVVAGLIVNEALAGRHFLTRNPDRP